MERTDLESVYFQESIYTQNTDLNYRLMIKDREANILFGLF